MPSIATTMGAALGLALSALPLASTQECDLDLITKSTAQFIEAQQTGQIQRMEALAYNTTYSENFNSSISLLFGIISQPQPSIAFNRSIYDPTGCASFTELVVTAPAHPYVIGAQMRFDAAEQTISSIDTIVTDAGDWLFNATGTLYWAGRERWDLIPADVQDSRETIKAAADAYLDIFDKHDTVVPWGSPCARLEGGLYTGTGAATDRCDVGLPQSNISLTNRRYVIDETLGTVDVYLNFGGKEGDLSVGVPDSHEFRVEGGKLRYVHTMTATNNQSLPARKRWNRPSLRAARLEY